jgi:peptidoglycan/LPS O-acetylase OafA/YrhL
MARPTTAQRSAPPGGEPTRRAATGTVIRPDIQALRALAVAMVLIYHLWPNRLSGGFTGVDVFFVISGFLITSHLLAHPPSRGRNLLEFWSRRVRRLLPAALLVLAATLIGTRIVAPDTVWGSSTKDIRAAALYFVNWRFAAQSVDYLAASNAPSPVEHFWSLSVEEQFYLIWPVVILIAVGIAKWRRWRLVPVTVGGLSAVVAASLAYSIYDTHTDPAQAYFVTPTRIWELGLGGLLAAALSSRALGRNRDSEAVPLPPAARIVLTWVGLAAMVWAAFVYTGSTPFPGYQALVPVLGAVAVIAAMPPRGLGSPAAVMAWRPVQWLGDVSYSVYLWHWPMIALLPYASGDHLGRLDKATIIVATLILAGLTKRYVEDRFRKPAWGRPLLKPYALGAALMAVVVVGCTAQLAEVNHNSTPPTYVAHGTCVGAAALANHCRAAVDRGPLQESAQQAANDTSDAYGYPAHPATCFARPPDYAVTVCHFGGPHATVKVALVGNSHAAEWLPALQQIVKQRHWSLDTYLATRCANAIGISQIFKGVADDSAECDAWAKNSTTQIVKGRYDLVVMSNRVSGPARPHATIDASQAAYAQGYLAVLKQFQAAGLSVVGVHDTPAPSKYIPGNFASIPDCLAAHGSDLGSCDGPRSKYLPVEPLQAAVGQLGDPKITIVNLTKYICPQRFSRCPAVIGRIPVYFDNSHLTGMFSASLAPYLEPHLLTALGR